MRTGQNLMKNGQILSPLQKQRKRLIEESARQDAESFADSHIDEWLEWLSRPKNRKDFESALRFLDAHLPKLLFALRDDGYRLPTITARQDEKYWRGNIVLYLIESDLLKALADYVSTLKLRKKSYAKTLCAVDLVDFFRANLGQPCLEKVGEILREEFPERASDGDLVEWVKKIVKRHANNDRRTAK
jgi:hypothetical protein